MNNDSKTNLPPHEQAFEWAWQAAQEKNWEEAALRWEVLRQAYPNHPATWLQAASAHIEAGEFEKAESLLTHALKEFSDHPLTLTESALLAMRQNRWSEAENYLQLARHKHADFMQTWLRSAECAEAMGMLDKATTYCEKACHCNPDIAGPYIQYAELAMRNEQWEQALERWKKLRTHFPENPTGYKRAAEAARQLNRPKDARQLLLAQQYDIDISDNDGQGNDLNNNDSLANNLPHEKTQSGHESLNRLLDLIWTKAIFNLRSEDHHNYLSYVWWVLEPLIHMAIYYLVFGYLLQRGGENFPAFLLTGLIPWMWFMKAVTTSSNSIIAGQNLLLQVGLPSIVFPLVSLVETTLKQIPVFALLFIFLWSQGFTPNSHWLALIPVIAVQTLLTIAFASMIAALIPFIRDLSYLVPTGLTLLMFLSGIFYDYSMIPTEWQSIFLMNPIAFLLQSYREIFIDNTLPDMLTLSWWGIGSATACIALVFLYKRLRYVFPRVLME